MEQQLEDITDCPICSDSLNDPRSLPCIHTFCLKCLEQHGRVKHGEPKMPCPRCRTKFTIPETGLSGLPKNFFIRKMLQIKKLSSGEQIGACEVCEVKRRKVGHRKTVAAVKYCVDCQEMLCYSCYEDHESHKMLRGHRLIDIDKVRGHESAEVFRTTIATCSKHKDQAMTVFCNDCKTPICVVCYISSHKQHDCSDIQDVIDKFRQQMTTDVYYLDDGVGKLRMMLASIEQQKQDFITQLAGTKDAIVKRAEELKQMVESNKTVLLGDLAWKERDVLEKLDNLSHEISRQASFAESLKKYTEELLTKGSICDIAQEVNALHDRVGELLKIDAVEKSRNNMHTIDVKYTGTVKFSISVTRSISYLIGFVEVLVKPKPVPQPTTPTLAQTLLVHHNGVCITLLNNHLFVLSRNVNDDRHSERPGKKTIEVYETTAFQLQTNIPVPGLQHVRDLMSCAVNNCLYASDPKTCVVFRVELSGKTTSWSVNSSPAGLSVNKLNNVLVTFSGENCVREFTTQGSLIREILLPRGSSPEHVMQLTNGQYNGQFLISSGRGVCIVNDDGQVVSQYSNSSRESVRINQPKGLALVENGCILVADRGLKQIVVINSSLTSARTLVLPADAEMQSPWALHYDEPRGRLYVAEYNAIKQRNINKERLGSIGDVFVFDNVFHVGNDLV